MEDQNLKSTISSINNETNANAHVLVVMGVSGCGKSTIGEHLSQRIGYKFFDADQLHSPANVEKMKLGIPLTDDDRQPWLQNISKELRSWLLHHQGSVLACSSLRKVYRDIIRQETKASQVIFIYLDLSKETLQQRLSKRHGHFMPVTLLDSQLATLEVPDPAKEDAILVNAEGSPDETVDLILQKLKDKGYLPS